MPPSSRTRGRAAVLALSVASALALALAPAAEAGKVIKKSPPHYLILYFTLTGNGSYHANASDPKEPKLDYFVDGHLSVGMNWVTKWSPVLIYLPTKNSALPPGVEEGLNKANEEGVSSASQKLSGTVDAGGDIEVPAGEGAEEPFSCSAHIGESPGAGSMPLTITKTGGETYLIRATGVGAPEYEGIGECPFPEGDLMSHYYWHEWVEEKSPFSAETTVTVKELSQKETTKNLRPVASGIPRTDCIPPGAEGESRWVGAEQCNDSFNANQTLKIEPECQHKETGKGYDSLSAEMKGDLSKLYRRLRAEDACFRFTIGTRSRSEQEDLYKRWHEIADGAQDESKPELKKELKEAGFAQYPKGWNRDGIAEGGPAKPGTSRHESAMAADITVEWPPERKEDNERYKAAAHEAGLCGPPSSDVVHVELPYKKRGEKKPSCHFG